MSTRPSKAKKASAPKKRGRPPKKENIKQTVSSANRQLAAIVLFGISLILGFLTFLEGENIWTFLHKGFFGLFGISAYLVAPLLLIISIILAFEKSIGSIRSKIIQAVTLVFLASGAFHIFFEITPVGSNFFTKLLNLFELGIEKKGGGLAAALFGWTLSSWFGKVAASVVIVIVIVVFLFIIFGVTVIDIISFFKNSVKKPVEHIEKAYQEHVEMRESAKEDNSDEYNPTIDIPLGPDSQAAYSGVIEDEAKRKHREKVKRAKDKLLDATMDENELAPKLENSKEIQEVKTEIKDEPIKEENQEEIIEVTSDDSDIGEQTSLYSTGSENRIYKYPPITLLNAPKIESQSDSENEIQQNADILMDTLSSFGVKTRLLGAERGPAVTRYELQPSAGVRISKITQLADDIALNLAATKVRIEAPIPNKAAVGIEVPNTIVSSVTLREIISSQKFKNSTNPLEVALGKDIAGNIITTDIAKMPHLLIAGTTGSGKSVCTNSMIISILYRSSPADVKMILIDPKMVEFNIYNGIPHLLVPVVTDPKKAAGALGWAVSEMEKRYTLFAEHNVKDIKSYNTMAQGSDTISKLPHIIIIIDEFADLMMTAPGDVESAVCRIAQKARAAGMHLVIATQRPSVNVITGLIKANITSRIALTVSSSIDSRTIIDTSGAEALLGRGDMLFKPYGSDRMLRVQGCFVSEKEIKDVVSYIKNNESAEYDETVIDEIEKQAVHEKGQGSMEDSDEGSMIDCDPLFCKVVDFAVENGSISTSLLQRKFSIGFSRAGRIMDKMEEAGIVGPQQGSKPREILISRDQWLEMSMKERE